MTRLPRLFVREVNLAIVGLFVATLLAGGAHYVSVVHELGRVREELCAAKIEAIAARHAYLRITAELSDKCALLATLTGDQARPGSAVNVAIRDRADAIGRAHDAGRPGRRVLFAVPWQHRKLGTITDERTGID